MEICAKIHSTKYIHKYVYKKHDCAKVQVVSEKYGIIYHDEVSSFLNIRHASSSEATYRIFAYPMHQKSHSVMRLTVHLPNEQYIYFHNDNAAEVLPRTELKNSKLIAWFRLNSGPATKNPHIYPETPFYYSFDNKKLMWKKSVILIKIVRRMYNVSPNESEKYHLLLLLLHVVGSMNF